MTQAAHSLIPTEPKNVLTVSGLNVFYGESHILRNVDLHIPEGEMVCLIGRNGVGKTTFLKTIIGLLQQRSGSVDFEGTSLMEQPPYQRARAGIGYVSQGRDIIPQLTVRDLSGGQQQQLAIARAMLGKPRLMLLDEPTEGIQPSIILDIERAVKRIMKETGISVLLVEQHLHFVRQASFYYAMQRGGIVASGPISTLSDEIVSEFLTV
jgi:urea transport system ATP-binding protein